MAKRSKKYLDALKLVDRSKRYTLTEAVELAKKTSFVKFD
ncbi:MAG: 50S ribosomal protein L1, partial [Acholeplasmataceae bacterium]|nr:50S ribosomal protein L1 [Acholeplasmataceae bacterium]